MRARLYVMPGSVSSMTGRLLLEHKGIAYRRIDLAPAVHRVVLRALRFSGSTVPALVLDGRRIHTSMAIARALDELVPDPPLLPDDPERRSAVLAAEAWGDGVLQGVARRLVAWSLRRDRSPLAGIMEGSRVGIPIWLAARTARPLVALSARAYGATDAAVRADLAALPAHLDRIDAWIAAGVLGDEHPSAADFQIAPCVRAFLLFEQLQSLLAGRPAAELARRVVRDYPGRIGPSFPDEWLPAPAPAGTGAAAPV